MPASLARAALPLLLAAIGALLVRAVFGGPIASVSTLFPVIWGLGVFVLLFFAIMFAYQWEAASGRRNAITWGGLIASLFAIHFFSTDYRSWEAARDWNTAALAMEPIGGVAPEPRIVLERELNGHYFITGFAGQASVEFMIDTGATIVALSPADAHSMGVQMERLDFGIPVRTADGDAFAAAITIPALYLHGHRFENVTALVMQGGGQSLLGMSVLDEFSSVQIAGNQMILER